MQNAKTMQATARKLEEQEILIAKWQSKSDELDSENRKLRNLPKLFASAQEEIAALKAALAAAEKQAENASVFANRKTAELSAAHAEVVKLSAIVDAHSAEESARRRVADLVGGSV